MASNPKRGRPAAQIPCLDQDISGGHPGRRDVKRFRYPGSAGAVFPIDNSDYDFIIFIDKAYIFHKITWCGALMEAAAASHRMAAFPENVLFCFYVVIRHVPF
jgi:hypothetical protein